MGDAPSGCKEVLDLIERYIDAELSADVVVVLEAHLETCPPCMRQALFERALKDTVRRKCSKEEVPAHVLENLRARLREL